MVLILYVSEYELLGVQIDWNSFRKLHNWMALLHYESACVFQAYIQQPFRKFGILHSFSWFHPSFLKPKLDWNAPIQIMNYESVGQQRRLAVI